MNDKITFRKINEIEWKMINNSLSTISKKIVSFLSQSEMELFIKFDNLNSISVYPLIYLVPKDLIKVINKIPKKLNMLCSGLYFGMLRKGILNLSLEGAEFLLRFDCFNDGNKLYVNDEGEKSILYGNHILQKYVSKMSTELYKNQFLLVLNNSHELIAIAKSRVNYLESKKLKPDDILALYLIDKGYYLRKEQ